MSTKIDLQHWTKKYEDDYHLGFKVEATEEAGPYRYLIIAKPIT